MSALAEALLAAQRQAVASLSKAFVAGAIDAEQLASDLDGIGLRDEVDQGLLLASFEVVKKMGGEAPAATVWTDGDGLEWAQHVGAETARWNV